MELFYFMALPEEIYQCQVADCGYIYSPNHGDQKGKVPAGTRFENLPKDWHCPCCEASRKMFRPLAGPGSVAAKSQNKDWSPD
jgi:rubredoxin